MPGIQYSQRLQRLVIDALYESARALVFKGCVEAFAFMDADVATTILHQFFGRAPSPDDCATGFNCYIEY